MAGEIDFPFINKTKAVLPITLTLHVKSVRNGLIRFEARYECRDKDGELLFHASDEYKVWEGTDILFNGQLFGEIEVT